MQLRDPKCNQQHDHTHGSSQQLLTGSMSPKAELCTCISPPIRLRNKWFRSKEDPYTWFASNTLVILLTCCRGTPYTAPVHLHVKEIKWNSYTQKYLYRLLPALRSTADSSTCSCCAIMKSTQTTRCIGCKRGISNLRKSGTSRHGSYRIPIKSEQTTSCVLKGGWHLGWCNYQRIRALECSSRPPASARRHKYPYTIKLLVSKILRQP